MSLLAGRYFRHVETGAIVQIIDTTLGTVEETGETKMIVRFVSECGREQCHEVESFMLDFELVEEVRSVTLTASWMDEEFWTAVEELASEFNASIEYDDGSGSMMGAVVEAEELEGGDFVKVERLH